MSDRDSERNLFADDRPIDRRSDDLLGRGAFAEAVAKAIAGWQHKDSLVIALCGPWGSGKSSVKNMVLEHLDKLAQDKPDAVEFSPWQWSSAGILAETFFNEIGKRLGKTDKSKEGKRRAKKWQQYAAHLGIVSTVMDPLPGWILSLLIAFGGISASTGSLALLVKDKSLTSPWVVIPASIFLGVLVVPKWLGGILQKSADAVSSRADDAAKDVEQTKHELAELLRGRTAPLLVVVDDVDRLTSSEIALLFRLVKANADFPNLVYLLVFQRDTVEKAIEKETSGDGSEYLEKIIQVPFDLPAIERSKLEEVLFRGLDQVLLEGRIGENFQKHRWQSLYTTGLKEFFQTLRDVRRFVSVFLFHVAFFHGDRAFEVNPVDLIALEAIRVFEPAVYARLSLAKEALTRRRNSISGDKKEIEEGTSTLLKAIVDTASESNRHAVREVLLKLFPLVQRALGGMNLAGGSEEEWYRELRVCHPRVFDRYFCFAIPEGDISQSEIQSVIDLAGDRKGLVAYLRLLNEDGRLAAMLNSLEAFKEKIDIEAAIPFVTALMDIGDELPDDHSIYTAYSSDDHVSRILFWYLKTEKDNTKRATILKEAIAVTTGLYLPVLRIARESAADRRQTEPDMFLIDADQVKELQVLVVQRIVESAKDGRLLINRHLSNILCRWSEWGATEQSLDWVRARVESDEGFLKILVAFMFRVQSEGGNDYALRERWQANLKGLEHFVSLENIETRLEQIKRCDLSPEQERSVRAFRRALQRRKEGKPDDGWPLDDED